MTRIGWLRADEGDHLKDWMAENSIQSIQVISPHFDDAAFSLTEFLTRPDLPPRSVFTIFTRAGEMTNQDYAQATGFADPAEEFSNRKQEDLAAMARLRVPFVHCGGRQGYLDQETVNLAAEYVLEGKDPKRTLILLPLGAGGMLHPLKRFIHLLFRLSTGSKTHQEHIWVRDQFRAHTKSTGATIGYYAEVPYQWANSPSELLNRAKKFCGSKVTAFSLQPNTDEKLAVAQSYQSQVEAEFGSRKSYQRRTASIPERIFLPAA